MLQRILSAGLCLGGLALVVLAATGYWTCEGATGISLGETEAEVQVGGPNEEKVVVFRLRNPTRRPVRIIGLDPC